MKQFYLYLGLLVGILAACTATTEIATIQPTRQIDATKTAVSTATAPPIPTETAIPPTPTETTLPPATEIHPTATAVQSAMLPPMPPLPAEDEISFSTKGHFAFVQDKNLYIQALDKMNPPVLVDSCAEKAFCLNHYFKWSPDGQRLLYFHTDDYEIGEIRLATIDGQWQTIGTDAHHRHPAAWSPDGTQIVYLHDTQSTQLTPVNVTDENGELITVDIDLPLTEVVVIPFANGIVGEPQINGTTTMEQPGCGGGVQSDSALLYSLEGGPVLGYRMGILEWTAQDILLFTSNCTNAGIDRYDLSNGTELDFLDKIVRTVVLSPDKSRWYGISYVYSETGDPVIELATGDPTTTAVTTIPTSFPVEMIFMGQHSGHLYLTSRETLEYEIDEQGAQDGYFFQKSSLWRMDEAGMETAVYTGDAYALAHVQEAADGTITFVQIENDIAQYEATKIKDTREIRGAYMPRRHIVALNQAGELLYLKPDAGTLAVTP